MFWQYWSMCHQVSSRTPGLGYCMSIMDRKCRLPSTHQVKTCQKGREGSLNALECGHSK